MGRSQVVALEGAVILVSILEIAVRAIQHAIQPNLSVVLETVQISIQAPSTVEIAAMHALEPNRLAVLGPVPIYQIIPQTAARVTHRLLAAQGAARTSTQVLSIAETAAISVLESGQLVVQAHVKIYLVVLQIVELAKQPAIHPFQIVALARVQISTLI
ncbi:hypothetical protein N7456_010513 [Penicillium angulare]|uniref:Uncharacterized protein n=1 Tax=Penicillium angulare TaxID=116970 RepID=A0A9W9K756_9EURO|nr:hypothetical protein N7456_010513 [Penicillium angulare]